MLGPRSCLALVALSACGPAMTAAEHDAPYLAARASEGVCDAACCEQMAGNLTAARADGDDRIADDLIARLALSCEDRRASCSSPAPPARAS